MQPPLPQPAPYTCQHCGAAVEEKSDFCPQCGALMGEIQAAPFHKAKEGDSDGSGIAWLKVLGALGLGLVALIVGAAGACFWSIDATNVGLPLVLVALLLGVGGVLMFGSIFRKRN